VGQTLVCPTLFREGIDPEQPKDFTLLKTKFRVFIFGQFNLPEDIPDWSYEPKQYDPLQTHSPAARSSSNFFSHRTRAKKFLHRTAAVALSS
jgi:hypothetical protein